MAYGGRGFGGGMNMQVLMKQAQQMQEQLKKAQEELKESEFIGSAGGMVNVTVSGAKEVLAVSIKPEAIDPDDIEMLEDLITAAVNDALNKVAEKEHELMPNMGGLGL